MLNLLLLLVFAESSQAEGWEPVLCSYRLCPCTGLEASFTVGSRDDFQIGISVSSTRLYLSEAYLEQIIIESKKEVP